MKTRAPRMGFTAPALLALVGWLFCSGASAKIPEPDHVLYGNATRFAENLPAGTEVTLVVAGQDDPISRYEMGSDPSIGSFFALRIPMDSVDPRVPGTARPGEQAKVYIAGTLAANVQIGQLGKAVRLDIDPVNLEGGGPNITVDDVSLVEGNGGTTAALFTLSLSTTSAREVSVAWATANETATGGSSCSSGADYIGGQGTARFAPGTMWAQVSVAVCGETLDEVDERFTLNLSSPVNGHVSDAQGSGTIIDDDVMPVITINDTSVIEPPAGSASALFTLSLSEVWNVQVKVNYAVSGDSAVAGSDFVAASGTLTIPAGSPTVALAVTVLADAIKEGNESFRVTLSGAVNADIADPIGIGTIIDPAMQPELSVAEMEANAVDNVEGLTGPSAVVISPEGLHVYVAARTSDSILLFRRSSADGKLQILARYQSTDPGFEDAALDGAADLAMSPDGLFLYVAGFNDDGIAVFKRNPANGALAFVESYYDEVQLNGVTALAVSPDGAQLYAAAKYAGDLVAFKRDTASGRLTWLDLEADNDDLGIIGLSGISGVTLSRDGAHLYATSAYDNGVVLFERDKLRTSPGYGQLTREKVYRDGQAGVKGIRGASALALSGDGVHLYVTGESDDSVGMFTRDAWTGELTWFGQVLYSDPGVAGMLGPQAVELSKDGAFVYVTGYADDTLMVFERERDQLSANYGRLTASENIRNRSDGVFGIAGPTDIAVSPDDQDLFVTGFLDNALVVFRRQPLPIFSNSFE